MNVVTTEAIHGYQIEKTIGQVFGVVVRSRGIWNSGRYSEGVVDAKLSDDLLGLSGCPHRWGDNRFQTGAKFKPSGTPECRCA
jgi:Putative heavy-metal-binding